MPLVWVHSLWSLAPGSVSELVKHLSSRVLQDAEPQPLSGGFLLRQEGTFEELPKDDPWVRAHSSSTTELAGLYVLEPEHYGLRGTGGRSLVGAASPRPASNHALVDRVAAALIDPDYYHQSEPLTLLPTLSKDNLLNLKGLTVYEARTEREDREVSITYLTPTALGLLDEWADSTEFAGVTVNWNGHLASIFADGQLWLEGISPEDVPLVVGTISVNLWRGVRIEDAIV